MKIKFFFSGLIVRNDKLSKKGNEVNKLLISKCGTREILFIDGADYMEIFIPD